MADRNRKNSGTSSEILEQQAERLKSEQGYGEEGKLARMARRIRQLGANVSDLITSSRKRAAFVRKIREGESVKSATRSDYLFGNSVFPELEEAAKRAAEDPNRESNAAQVRRARDERERREATERVRKKRDSGVSKYFQDTTQFQPIVIPEGEKLYATVRDAANLNYMADPKSDLRRVRGTIESLSVGYPKLKAHAVDDGRGSIYYLNRLLPNTPGDRGYGYERQITEWSDGKKDTSYFDVTEATWKELEKLGIERLPEYTNTVRTYPFEEKKNGIHFPFAYGGHLNDFRCGGKKFDEGGDKPDGKKPGLIRRAVESVKDKVRRKLYDNIDPIGYNEFGDRLAKALTGNGEVIYHPYRDAIFAEYLGIPEGERHAFDNDELAEPVVVRDSEYVPSLGREEDRYRAVDFNDNSKFNLIYEALSSGKPSAVGRSLADAFGPHTIGVGTDDRGQYVSYYDLWDINPTYGQNAAELNAESRLGKLIEKVVKANADKDDVTIGIGNPLKLYDRIYLDDYFGVKQDTPPGPDSFNGGYIAPAFIEDSKFYSRPMTGDEYWELDKYIPIDDNNKFDGGGKFFKVPTPVYDGQNASNYVEAQPNYSDGMFGGIDVSGFYDAMGRLRMPLPEVKAKDVSVNVDATPEWYNMVPLLYDVPTGMFSFQQAGNGANASTPTDLFSDEAKAIRRIKHAYVESRLNRNAENKKSGARGLFQIMPIAEKDYLGRGRGKQGDIWDSGYNGDIRDWLMKIIPGDLREFWSEDDSDINKLAKLYAAYNWGAGNLRKFFRARLDAGLSNDDPYEWVEAIQNKGKWKDETKNYVKFLALDQDIPGSYLMNEKFENAARRNGYMAEGGRLFEMGGDEKKKKDFSLWQKMLGVPKLIEKYSHGAIPRDKASVLINNPTGWAQELFSPEQIEEIRQNLYDNFLPFGYTDNQLKAAGSAAFAKQSNIADTDRYNRAVRYNLPYYGEITNPGIRDEMFALYLNPKNKRSHPITFLKETDLRPTRGNTYERVYGFNRKENPYFETNLVNSYFAASGGNDYYVYDPYGEKGTVYRTFKNGKSDDSYVTTALGYGLFGYGSGDPSDNAGDWTLSSGVDPNRGQYISFYDDYDLNPVVNSDRYHTSWFGAFPIKTQDASGGIGSPFTIYDRVYLDDYYGVDSRPQNPDEFYGGYIMPTTITANKEASGGKIHIKPENRGKFTALLKRTGKSASWFKEHGTPLQRKRATFALNARKWKHGDGGPLDKYGDDAVRAALLKLKANRFQNGGEERTRIMLDTPAKIPSNMKDVWDASGFVEDYYNSEGYKKRLAFAGLPVKSLDLKANLYASPSMETWDSYSYGNDVNVGLVPYYFDFPTSKNVFGETMIDYRISDDNKYGQGLYPGTVAAHEMAHLNPLYNTRYKDWYHPLRRNKDLSPYYGNDYSKVPPYWMYLLRPNKSVNEHDYEANENYSDLMALRYFLQKNGIFDSMDPNAEFKSADYDKIFEHEGGEHLRYLMHHSKDAVIKAINEVASRGDKDDFSFWDIHV